jgi:hypothetical protein
VRLRQPLDQLGALALLAFEHAIDDALVDPALDGVRLRWRTSSSGAFMPTRRAPPLALPSTSSGHTALHGRTRGRRAMGGMGRARKAQPAVTGLRARHVGFCPRQQRQASGLRRTRQCTENSQYRRNPSRAGFG